MHAVSTPASPFVQLPWSAWKTPLPGSHPPPLTLTIFLLILHNDPLTLEGRGENIDLGLIIVLLSLHLDQL